MPNLPQLTTGNSQLILRPATPDDAPTLTAWDKEQHVIDCAPNDIWDWDHELALHPPWRELLVAEVEGRQIGFMQIIEPEAEETHYWGDCGPGLRAIDIWIGPADALGQGYGTEMMRQALNRCFADLDVEAILIDPLAGNHRAHGFYERLGFTFERECWFDEDHCYVFRLTRERWQRPVMDPEIR